MACYLFFHAVIYYFEYAVGVVRGQERGAEDKEPDGLLVGSGIAAYIHIVTCLELFGQAVKMLSIASNRSFQTPVGWRPLQRRSKRWKDMIRNKRNRLAHPEEDKNKGADKNFYIMQKRSWTRVEDDGAVEMLLRQVSIKKPTESEGFELNPRKDLEKLREYLTQAANEIRSEVERVA